MQTLTTLFSCRFGFEKLAPEVSVFNRSVRMETIISSMQTRPASLCPPRKCARVISIFWDEGFFKLAEGKSVVAVRVVSLVEKVYFFLGGVDTDCL